MYILVWQTPESEPAIYALTDEQGKEFNVGNCDGEYVYPGDDDDTPQIKLYNALSNELKDTLVRGKNITSVLEVKDEVIRFICSGVEV